MGDVFITENFLLQNDAAVELYHDYARDLPIIDYHCHLPPQQVADDHRFENLTQIWLAGDHYKWRAMRAAGVPERFCTGDASDWEKFQKWAETVPQTLRNPLYHWTHLELKRPFGISDRLLGPDTAEGIWDECNAKLAQPEFSCRGIMRQMNVVLVCTTDDPADTLEHHAAIAADPSFPIQVLPTFRPDKAMAVENRRPRSTPGSTGWPSAAGIDIGDDFDALSRSALRQRHDFFHAIGLPALRPRPRHVLRRRLHRRRKSRAIFRSVRGGQALRADEIVKFKSAMLYELAVMDHEKGWTQQFHFGALRNNNTRMFKPLGPGHGLRLDRRLRRWPGRWRGSSTGSTATAGWPRRSSTTSTRPTTKCWPR